MTLVKQVFLPQGFSDPPDGFNILVGESDVGILQADPESNPVGQALPVLDIVESGAAAELVEAGNAVLFDLCLAGKAELFLHRDLNRQSVGIPAAAAHHMVAAHTLVAREYIFKSPRQDMVHARHAVGGWRAFVEDKLRTALALGAGFFEDSALRFQKRRTSSSITVIFSLGETGLNMGASSGWF